jgi:predicted hotdog family 3-hydroxylacyl-ACP dehydratase
MKIAKQELSQLLPHGGEMCLLHEVAEWDDQRILCLAINHVDPANPLRFAGQLPALCAVEYAAQAMAVHGGLIAQAHRGKPKIGFLGSVRDVCLRVDRLDDLPVPLEIRAVKQLADENHCLYEFQISAAGRELIYGRAAVFLRGEEAA